ncbi:BaiN/RdsA family NAD(P)/FAD-dependent oxidoreductase [Neptunitalea lumnitzerae]|uniref:Flavoprotein n=1 Tax=Neptunitalea lumnitzerae TaxID=2965509 RepID=A0ABQ5MEW5_9FLAO|nr:NAD(P)/FAD-dependent oxidoreductase [Neptunitalea sp. Y10]GLB47918.1 flavoprotein [Neptunitalea sp. Y10]
METDVLVIGGGAAGFFTAINIAAQSNLKVAIAERGKEVLTKVKISGGGRCNVTHAEFIPKELVKFYPRGEKELKGPFHTFMSGDVMEWFESRGVALKIEEDGRIFPVTDSSQTIIDCFLNESKKHGVTILKGMPVKSIHKVASGYQVQTAKEVLNAKAVVVATGSNPKIWQLLEGMGHSIVPPVPSLFTFNCTNSLLKPLPGVATMATVKVVGTKLTSSGPLLITHWGFSGPAILKLSAWGARDLSDLNYQFTIQVNWLHQLTFEDALEMLKTTKEEHPKKTLGNAKVFDVPKRLWEGVLTEIGLLDIRWADISKKQINALAHELTSAAFQINGKSTFKEEFVTAGGVELKEVNFKTYESKLHPGLYLAGEVLNIDAITGGFNFQNAWTSGFIAAKAIVSQLTEH